MDAPPDPGILTDDDLDILRELSTGRTVEAVARGRHVSERTVRRRLRAIDGALGVDSTIAAVVEAVRRGLI